jgi:two-component system chemotaxis response regulator CheB
MTLRVLTVDDSPFFLELLAGIIHSSPGLLHVGSARNGVEAVAMVAALSPDVVTLDVEMPVMDGLATLARIMESTPTRVIMVSSHTRRASAATIRALALGAADFVTKPADALKGSYAGLRTELVEKIHALGPTQARKNRGFSRAMDSALKGAAPRMYAQEFARSLADACPCPVHLVRNGQFVEPGSVFVAQGGLHLTMFGTAFRVSRGEPVQGHVPSIDVTMASAARSFGTGCCGVLLTGMGRDGARGIGAIRDAGGSTIAQDESTSVVFGMPRAAIESGKVDRVMSLEQIARQVAELTRK